MCRSRSGPLLKELFPRSLAAPQGLRIWLGAVASRGVSVLWESSGHEVARNVEACTLLPSPPTKLFVVATLPYLVCWDLKAVESLSSLSSVSVQCRVCSTRCSEHVKCWAEELYRVLTNGNPAAL